MYPVDLPAVDDELLTSTSQQYLSFLESIPHNHEEFSQMSKVAITANNIRWLQLFEDGQHDCTLLALQHPDDPTQVVAVYLHEEWWLVDDVLRTSNKSRNGLIMVQSIVERVIVFLLSQVVERSTQEKVLFSLHPRTESCKLLWRDSQAVGFYTVKHKGSLFDSCSGQCYLLPVLDTVLVRKSWRRRGSGLHMLEDFCSTFRTEKFLGVSSPLSPSMAAVCRRFLQQCTEHQECLYEVEAPGAWTQRRNIWLNIQLGHYCLSISEENSLISGESKKNEGNDSSHKTCRHDLTSFSTCNVTTPLVTGPSEEQLKPCDPSPCRVFSGTGYDLAAHAKDLNPVTLPRLPQSLKAGHDHEKPEAEKTQTSVKRARRT